MRTLGGMLTALLLAAALVPVASAMQPPPEPANRPEPPRQLEQRVRISLDQAVSIARRHVPGRVVGAQTRMLRGRIIHQVKILTSGGTVRVVRVDGETGRILR